MDKNRKKKLPNAQEKQEDFDKIFGFVSRGIDSPTDISRLTNIPRARATRYIKKVKKLMVDALSREDIYEVTSTLYHQYKQEIRDIARMQSNSARGNVSDYIGLTRTKIQLMEKIENLFGISDKSKAESSSSVVIINNDIRE